LSAKAYRLDIVTGKRTFWKAVIPADPAGIATIGPIQITPNGKSYVYGFTRTLADLYLVEGLKYARISVRVPWSMQAMKGAAGILRACPITLLNQIATGALDG
jgi:hypothetical protein